MSRPLITPGNWFDSLSHLCSAVTAGSDTQSWLGSWSTTACLCCAPSHWLSASSRSRKCPPPMFTLNPRYVKGARLTSARHGLHECSGPLLVQGTSVCQATAIGAVVILLYTSRACYNLVVVSLSPQDRPSPFNYGWYSVSDQVRPPGVNDQLQEL